MEIHQYSTSQAFNPCSESELKIPGAVNRFMEHDRTFKTPFISAPGPLLSFFQDFQIHTIQIQYNTKSADEKWLKTLEKAMRWTFTTIILSKHSLHSVFFNFIKHVEDTCSVVI